MLITECCSLKGHEFAWKKENVLQNHSTSNTANEEYPTAPAIRLLQRQTTACALAIWTRHKNMAGPISKWLRELPSDIFLCLLKEKDFKA
ncbi:MAG: hypothetical protein HYZ83_07110 [Candidatus Omnitrophica bacterium]|nr:hypothetical protein [Candidatus Omnitrophota bacterium]